MIGSKTLLTMREKGARPPGFIVATECRDIARNARNRDLYPLVFDPESVDDWRLIHGLDVMLATKLPREKVSKVCAAIFEAQPRSFSAQYFHSDEFDWVIPLAAR